MISFLAELKEICTLIALTLLYTCSPLLQYKYGLETLS
jgi:hypothetical protein